MMKLAKIMLAAALLAAPLSGFAQSEAATTPPMRDMSAMKAKMAERKAKMDQEITAHRAEMDQHRNVCAAKAQAAGTPEEMRSIMQTCRAEGQAMHKAKQSERQAKKAAWQEKRAGMKAEREAKRANAAQ